MTRFATSPNLLVALLFVPLVPQPLEAQRRGRAARQVPTAAWPAVSVGAHAGYDDASNGTVLGAQIRAPIVRSGKVEIMPSGNVTFLTGLKEYQFNLDAVFVPGGREGGLYVAGGLALRNTIFPGATVKETRTGAGLAVGIRSGAQARVGVQLEFRQIFVDSDLRPRLLALGINLPLWGGGDRSGR